MICAVQVEEKGPLCENDVTLSEGPDYDGCDVFGSGPEAAESENAWKTCEKHPGHANFIPITEFGLNHLPEQYRTQSIKDLVNAIAVVTVKLVVRCNSPERMPRYCYSMSGERNSAHVGSGWILDIQKGKGPCRGCFECDPNTSEMVKEPAQDKEKWYLVYVISANHVVFDSEEAKATEVQLFYDDKKSRKDQRMKSIYGAMLERGGSSEDSCVLICFTHNERLAKELTGYVDTMKSMVLKGNRDDPLFEYEYVRKTLPEHQNGLCIMVSHPHGQPKMVTVGKREQVDRKRVQHLRRISLTERSRRLRLKNPLFYSTESCRGSSGSPVFMPVSVETRRKDPHQFPLVDAMVIRSHSIGNVFQGVGLSSGESPLVVAPLLALPPPLKEDGVQKVS
ncbi:hypothetical protein PoB_002648100 [Plakobranchus ocellatus]|uniref:Uncharacterized protein n=1 Tax=Plakobranchus ocellatus TaxID=259542 RepID=A0AAV3ZVK8_9GAST|nr:hypothetical protein PoB_002648100 [Plakobranchus ocellatus]